MKIELERYSANPILLPTNNSWENRWVYNCGVTIYKGKILLLYRAQGTDKISRLGMVLSSDGRTVDERSPEPIFSPDSDSEYETLGVEDPRITQIGQTYYIVYTAASLYPEITGETPVNDPLESPWRVRVSIAHTEDFQNFTRHGVVVSHIDSKDATLFPEKINGQYVLLHRVLPDIRLAIGDSFSHFKERGPIVWPRKIGWDVERIGIGSQPIKTPYGWLLVYHGTSAGRRAYSLGLLLLDLEDPTQVIGRSDEPILEPEEEWEEKGHVPQVVFTCGAVFWKKEFLVYYGGADEVIGLATAKEQAVLNWARGKLEEYRRIKSDHPNKH